MSTEESRKSSAGQNGRARSNGRAKKARVSTPGVRDVVSARPRSDLSDLYGFWANGHASEAPGDERALRSAVVEWMSDPVVLEERVSDMGRRLGAVFERLLRSPDYQLSYTQLANAPELSYLSQYDMEACLTALTRRALLVDGEDQRFQSFGERVLAVPSEVGDGVWRQRRERGRRLFDVLTLRGHLDRLYADPKSANSCSPQHLRRMYKMYSSETAAVARVERLPDGIRGLVEKAILEFGGVLPRGLFERMDTTLPHWNGRRWRKILEESLVGTVADIDLGKYGILHGDESLVVFNEVSLAWLRQRAVPGDPDRPHEELSLGVDLVTNLSRFLGFILENDVRFTVRGEIFKTTEKKILQYLIPNPGRELSREDVLRFLYRFARSKGLIDRTGERTLSVTGKGREWSQLPLGEKLSSLHTYSVEEKGLGGEPYHQTRLREIFMRMLKRIEPGVWYDLMYLPFLARNSYLASLDDLGVEEFFAERNKASRTSPLEDPQRLAWNVVRWVRMRLYLLGVVDLGYDATQRPVAMRVTKSGARLLGVYGEPEEEAPQQGTLVVTPDFEVVLFPSGDDAELAHDLDRFCVRDKKSDLLHFQISEESVRRALVQGMPLARIEATLEDHSRTPVPQNVSFSIRDWARRAGLMRLDEQLCIHCEDADTVRRFLQDPGVRGYVDAQIDDERVQLSASVTQRRMRSLLRDLGYLVEIG